MANEKRGSAVEGVPQRTEVPPEIEEFVDQFLALLDQAGEEEAEADDREDEDPDEPCVITSLVGLEDAPVFSSTDELTGEVIMGGGLRQRDLRPDGLHGGPTGESVSEEFLDTLDEAGLERYLASRYEDEPAPELKPATPEEVEALLERIRSKPMIDLNAPAEEVANAICAGVLANLPKDLGPDDEAEDEELAKSLGLDP